MSTFRSDTETNFIFKTNFLFGSTTTTTSIMTTDFILQPDYTIGSNGLPNLLNKNCDKIPRQLTYKPITDNVDSNKKLLNRRHIQLNNQISHEMFAITVNQRKMSSCTNKLEHHHGGGIDKKIKEKYNMRIRDVRVDGTWNKNLFWLA